MDETGRQPLRRHPQSAGCALAKGIKAKGQQRTQFHHVIDVVPTILEACKIPEPKVVNGIPQKPIEGVSMLYSFDNAKAKTGGRRSTSN